MSIIKIDPELVTPPVYTIAKTTPWLRMTSDEAAIMDAVMTETDAQQRQIYMAAQYLSSNDPLWQTLRMLMRENLPGGDARANQILAPEG
ncbi:hypothetical protein RMR10_011860 [Agrobacterium rosae]|uniref:hypothetical protein n=1 Tax=Agrobacterium rosae TaxID=1972867 RepID=UPI002A0C63D4|nr:hypothetical protein [Agrobacterium rosae]MDX8313323.1 hypothetical protein [Agrobacterium rosae]